MKLKHKIDIDLLTFFRTGKFDYLKLGQTKEWIIQNFPDPDGTNYEDTIWCYGNIEFYFDEDSRLWMIFCENVQEGIESGESILLDLWILDKPKLLSVKKIVSSLLKEGIDYQIKRNQIDKDVLALTILESGVELVFQNLKNSHAPAPGNEDPNGFKMVGFCKSEIGSRFKIV